jgi:hypothetical protein
MTDDEGGETGDCNVDDTESSRTEGGGGVCLVKILL